MDTSTPFPEDIPPEEPSPEALAAADQVSHLPASESTVSPEPADEAEALEEPLDDIEAMEQADARQEEQVYDASGVVDTGAVDDVAPLADASAADDTGEADPDVAATGTIEQLPAEDTLEDTGGRDRLDEGIQPPDAPGPLYEDSIGDEITGESLSERVEAEEPEVWDEEEGV